MFMSDCLSADKPTQQEKMTTCNKQAAEKKLAGDERKKFMSSCLSG
ncbi:MAG: PsiF family protein [Burkholderiaceae bacterium]